MSLLRIAKASELEGRGEGGGPAGGLRLPVRAILSALLEASRAQGPGNLFSG